MHLKNVLLGCLAVATVTACSNEEVMEQASQAPTEVQFRIDQQAITKAVKVDFVEGDAIGIYAVERLLDDEQAAVPTGESRAINVKYVKDKDGKATTKEVSEQELARLRLEAARAQDAEKYKDERTERLS